MSSAIDATKPVDNEPVPKSDIRNNFATAKSEITKLQRYTRLPFQAAMVLGKLTTV